MLICPQCKFKNPRVHNFCQNCGISLTHKTSNLSQQVPLAAEMSSSDNAIDDTVLWAIVSLEKSVELVNVISDRQGEKFLLSTQENKKHISHRYLLQGSFSAESSFESQNRQLEKFFRGKVIDRHPLRKSYLASLQERQPNLFAELSPGKNNCDLSINEYCNSAGLPTHALPYLILQKYTPIVPQIYDTWQQPGWGVILLPDRSQWKLVSEFWSRSQLPLLQIVWFLDEMAKLWQPLKSIGCLTSLLINDNLRIDEDESFCLQQLHFDADDSPTLKDLARTWQSCFAEANLLCVDPLQQLLDKIISAEIVDIEHLRLELQSFSNDELEPDLSNIYPHLSTMSISPSEPEITKSEFNSATFESDFFDEIDEMNYTSEFEEEATAMIPMQLRNITEACCSDIGKKRDHNEDFFSVRTRIEKIENNTESVVSVRGLYVVCDGMGGHAAGEVASAMAVENLQTYFKTYWQSELPDRETIERGILLTNEAIYRTNLSNSRSGSGRMGTTLVMALLQETQLAIAHVGDSRIYRLSRKQGLEQLTQDHEVGQREINRGVEPEIAYGRPDAYQLTQALGPRENKYVRPEIKFVEITEDCLILLCSDGLSDNEFIEQNWSEHLEPLISSDSNLQEGLFKFVDLADRHNGHDNITAVLLKIKLKPDL